MVIYDLLSASSALSSTGGPRGESRPGHRTAPHPRQQVRPPWRPPRLKCPWGLRAALMLDLSPSLGSYWPAVPVALRVQARPWVMEILWLEQLPCKLEAPWAAVSGLRPLQPCPCLGAWAQGKQGLFVLEADPVTSKQTFFLPAYPFQT